MTPLALISFAVVVALDFLSPAGMVSSVLFVVPIGCAVWSRNERLLWALSIAALCTTLAAVFRTAPPPPPGIDPGLMNRLIAGVAIIAISVLGHVQIRVTRLAEQQRGSLDRQNQELAEFNEQISQREEEIVRQNEELQSQTEELERQSEELRITNEELASWEKRLEQLLELSRSLTAELSRGEILTRICESLALLSDGRPAAVLEKQGDEMKIICHHGFGPGGPTEETIPYEHAFSSLVASVGQTAYVEDIQFRPEFHLPAPQDGTTFRSVLASPLCLHGRCIGTIEVYSAQPRVWGQADVSMIESMTAQASVSLQSAELVDQIRQERRRFEAAFRTVPFGMAVTDDPRCREVRINPAAAAMFNIALTDNLSPYGPVGARLVRQLVQGNAPIVPDQHPLVRAARGEDIVNEELDFAPPQGKKTTLLTSAAPIHDGESNIVGAVCAFVDVTVQKSLQRELDLRRREAEEASVRKTRFLAAVSHDIRTPANAINLMVELIRRYAADAAFFSEVPKLAEDLQRNTFALMELVDDMLDLSRFDTGKMELVESDFGLNELVAQEVRHLEPIARDKGVQLVIEPTSEDLQLRTDRVKLARVLGNLIGNALKFTEKGSVRVQIKMSTEPARRIAIRIMDTGLGIPASFLTTIFDEFAQVHNPARDRSKGAGLGLAICKRLLDLMGGLIEVDSEIGVGSTFSVILPASCVAAPAGFRMTEAGSSESARVPPASDERSKPLSLRVLLVEDHSSTRDGVARLLRQEGAIVVEAANGAAAIQEIEQQQFDVVLVDMMLPDMDGREVIRLVQERCGDRLPALVVMTGDLTKDRLEEVAALKTDGLMAKPVNIDKLVTLLRGIRRSSD